MKKLGKRLGIVAIIAVVLYAAWMIFVNPTGYTDKTDLARDYFTNMDSSTACSTYFTTETADFCADFASLFDGEDVTVTKVVARSSVVVVTIDVNGNEEDFEVSFVSEPVTGVKHFFNSVYYKIYDIQ